MKNITLLYLLIIISSVCKAQDHYNVLKRELDGSYCTLSNKLQLNFTIDGDYNNTALDYHVYNFQRVVMTGLSVAPVMLNNGDNRFVMDVTPLATGYYILEVINQKKEKRVLRFYIP